MTEKNKFIDFITSELKYKIFYEDKAETFSQISKLFKKNKKDYVLVAHFDNNGKYLSGFLALITEYLKVIAGGEGLSFDSFLQRIREELR